MQAHSHAPAYLEAMAAKSRLRELREASGLSVRELARQIDEQHTNVIYWETSGNLPRSNVLIPMAKALGVTVEELLGEPPTRKSPSPGGRLAQAFADISRLPRRQQEKIIEVIHALLAQHREKNTA